MVTGIRGGSRILKKGELVHGDGACLGGQMGKWKEGA